jgi:IclR family transcriptional regulator, KDG regulon repressor
MQDGLRRVAKLPEITATNEGEPKRDLRVNAIVGRRRPLHAGSSKAFLAHMDDEEREAILSGPLKRFTKKM